MAKFDLNEFFFNLKFFKIIKIKCRFFEGAHNDNTHHDYKQHNAEGQLHQRTGRLPQLLLRHGLCKGASVKNLSPMLRHAHL